ncbi:MAG: adenosylcobinamide-phosphate synthase CbiB [bacterium]
MAFIFYPIFLFPLAFLIEFYTGPVKYKLHPLNIMGRIAKYLEKLFYSVSDGIISGIMFNILTVFTICGIIAALSFLTIEISPALFYLLSLYILASFLSTGGLRHESIKIYGLLKAKNIEAARKSLLSLAGRDSGNLSNSEISRAVVESVSENTGDGIGSVIFYFTAGLIAGSFILNFTKIYFFTGYCFAAAFGVLSAAVYKSVNLLDSLTGYKNEKYEKFGKFSARLDDALNYIPFRITAFFMLISTFFLGLAANKNNYRFKDAFKSWIKFKKNHPSPNGGQLESIAAGALNVKLGGVNYYGGVESKRPVIGFENYGAVNQENIIGAVRIMELTSALIVVFYSAVLTCTLILFNLKFTHTAFLSHLLYCLWIFR